MKTGQILSNQEISSFCGQVSLILEAGITPAEGMSILLSDTHNKEGQEVIQQIYDVCATGETFYTAVKSCQVFPDYVLHMIELGEESGNLDVVMKSLSDYYEREDSIAHAVKSAISYPLIMIFMMMLVILVLITKVLPIFNQVFRQLGSEMSGFASSLLHLGEKISKYSLIFLIVILALVILYFLASKTKKGQEITRKFLLRFPLTKTFYDSIASGRFASGMALTLSSGLDTYHSLDLVSELVDTKSMQDRITLCKNLIQSGANFSEGLAQAGIFSNLYSRMVAVGFRTGTTDIVMKKIAEDYEKETNQRISSILSILEPTLVIMLSLVVGLILLSVILPLMGIMSSIG